MPRPRRRTSLAAAGGALVIGLAAWVTLSGPVPLHVRFGPMDGDPQFTVWNPVRDRTPEHLGAEYLRRIQSVNCLHETAGLKISDRDKAEACDKQFRHPVTTACRLGERRDLNSSTLPIFRCPEKGHGEMSADIALTMEHRKDAWSLAGYERIY